MTNRWPRLAMLAGLLLALAGMAGAGTTVASAATTVTPARYSASTASQPEVNASSYPIVVGVVDICNHGNTALCLQGEGVGNQMIVASSSYAHLTEIEVGTTSNNYPILEFQNPNGHCVYANGSGQVVLENAECGGNSYEEWRDQPGDYAGYNKLQNVDYGGYMLIGNNLAGEYVWEGPTTGNYYNWKLKQV